MSISNFRSGASRRVRHTVSRFAASTSYATSSASDGTRRTESLSCASTLSVRASIRSFKVTGRLPRDRAGALDLLLQLNDAVDKRFGRRRTAGDINIDGHYAITTAYHGVGIVIVAATVRARAHGDHPTWLGHLVVN